MTTVGFRTLLRLEWRLWRAEPTCWLTALAVTLGAGYAAGNGLAWARATTAAHETAAREDQARFTRLREARAELDRRGVQPGSFAEPASPFLVGDFNPRYAAVTPRPLAFLAVGQSDVYPSYFRITGERRDSFIDVEEIDHPLNLGNGRFDLAFFVSVILPLILPAISCNVVSADREQGTLFMTLAQPVPFRRLLVARLAVRAMLVIGTLTATTTGFVLLDGTTASDRSSLIAYGLGGLGVIAAVSWWLLVGAAVSARGWSSSTNAIVGLAIWLGAAVLAPVAIHATASTVHPMPPRVAILEHTRELDTAVRAEAPRLLDAYYAAHPADRPPNLDVHVYDFALHWTAIQREIDRRMAPRVASYEEALRAQQRLGTILACLSPPLAVQELLTDLAGTGARRHLAFLSQVVQFHDAHRAFFDTRTLRRALLTVADYDRMPVFTFRDEPVSVTDLHTLAMLMALGMWSAAAAGTLWSTLRR